MDDDYPVMLQRNFVHTDPLSTVSSEWKKNQLYTSSLDVSLCVSSCLINSNGFDLLWFIYNFPHAFDIQSAGIKNSGLIWLMSFSVGYWLWTYSELLNIWYHKMVLNVHKMQSLYSVLYKRTLLNPFHSFKQQDLHKVPLFRFLQYSS